MVALVARRKATFLCPFCRSALYKRTSQLAHQFLRNDVFVCDNPLCSASFNAHTELTHLASPSGIPHALPCELPETPHLMRAKLQRAYRAESESRQLNLLDTCEETEGAE